MKIVLAYLNKCSNTMFVIKSGRNIEVIWIENGQEIRREFNYTDEPRLFLQFLLDDLKTISYIDKEEFNIPYMEIDWMKKSDQFYSLNKQFNDVGFVLFPYPLSVDYCFIKKYEKLTKKPWNDKCNLMIEVLNYFDWDYDITSLGDIIATPPYEESGCQYSCVEKMLEDWDYSIFIMKNRSFEEDYQFLVVEEFWDCSTGKEITLSKTFELVDDAVGLKNRLIHDDKYNLCKLGMLSNTAEESKSVLYEGNQVCYRIFKTRINKGE